MTAYEYWVDNATGSNSNDGSEGSPWLTLRHATTAGLPNGLTGSDSVIINVVPGTTYTAANDQLRFEATECQGVSVIVRSSLGSAVPFVVNEATQPMIYMIGNADLDLRLENCRATRAWVLLWAGMEVDNASGIRLTLAGDCVFTHDDVTAEDFVNFDSNALSSSLTIEPGCQINGWASLGYGLRLTALDVQGMLFNAGSCAGDSSLFIAPDMTLARNVMVWPNSALNNFALRCDTGNVVVEENEFDIATTNTVSGIHIFAPLVGTAGDANFIMRRNTITGDTPAGTPLLHIGNIINTGLSRAANDATVEQFESFLLQDNDIVNRAEEGGVLRCLVGTDNLVGEGNYLRAGTLGGAFNVHQIYLWGADIRFEYNLCQAQVLAFGPGQIVRDNIVVAERCVLLGGTGGGSTVSGGGNDYFVTNNVLVAFANECLNDYAYGGSYGSSGDLGELRAVVDSNTYVVLDGAEGIANLTDANGSTGLTPTTLEQLQNVWQYTALAAGTRNTWGEATNKANDGASVLLSGSVKQIIASECVDGAALLRTDLLRLKNLARTGLGSGSSTGMVSSIVGSL